MEIFYKAYSKIVQDKKYYFVKKIAHFPEYKQLDDLLWGYGMHTNFNTACDIAEINSEKVRLRLYAETQEVPTEKVAITAKLINIYTPVKHQKNFLQFLLQSLTHIQHKFIGLHSKTAG
ncbi:MAG: hypothetical protein ABJA37_11060 [Ferruginibacter sp.]